MFHGLSAGNTWQPPITGSDADPEGVVAVGVGVAGFGVAVFVGVAVAGFGVAVFVGVATAGLGVGVFVAVATEPHRATSSPFETLLVVSRAPSHFRRTWSPGFITVSLDAANVANAPSARNAEIPITVGRNRRNMPYLVPQLSRGLGVTSTFDAPRETFEGD